MLFEDILLKKIFLVIVLGFSLGIISFYRIPSEFSNLFLFAAFLLSVIWFSGYKHKWFRFLVLFSLFFSIGYQSIYQRTVAEGNVQQYIPGDVVEAQIKDISHSNKLWKKAILELTYVFHGNTKFPISEKVLFLVSDEIEGLEKGDVLLLNSTIQTIQNKGNPGEFDGVNYWKSKGISKIGFLVGEEFILQKKESNKFVKWFNWMDRSLSKLFEEKLSPESIGIAKALILGDRDHLDSEVVRSFGNAGAMHVLAVSGLHVGLILALLLFVLSRFPNYVSKYNATLIALIIIWFYALLTGFSPSVLRAVVMFSLLTLAKLSGKNYDSINVLMISALILLLFDPLLLFDLGFQLSYLAMLGIFILYQPIMKSVYISNKWIRLTWEGTCVSIAAQVFTLPLILYCFHQFPNYFLIANIGLMVLTNIVLVSGVLLISLQIVPLLSTVLAWILSFSVISMFVFVQWVEGLPASTSSGFEMKSSEVLGFYFMILLILLFVKKKGNWAYLGSGMIIISCLFVVHGRYKNVHKNEWIVFNENKLTLLVKIDNEIYCFYEKDEDLPKSVYLAQSYQKTRTGKLNYCLLDKRKVELTKHNFTFSCERKKSYYDIKINDKCWKLVKQITTKNAHLLAANSIYMPWLKLDNVQGHLLHTGAFVRKI